MLKQLLVSAVMLLVAVAAYVFFVPGSDATLRSLGINLPFPTAQATAPASAEKVSGTTAAATPRGAPGRSRGGAQVQTVITGPVTLATINDRLSAIGEGGAAQSVSVTTQATGTLVSLNVKPGDTVTAGEVIGQLDAEAETIAYDKATLAAKDAAAALQRAKTLAQSNAATTVQLAAAQLAAANAELELRNAKLALDKRHVVTPINGKVGLFQVTPGNAVSAQTVVTTVDDTSSILVNYWVPERYAQMVKPGMAITARSIARPDQSYDGAVAAIDSRIDPASRTLKVQASIPNAQGTITAGSAFEVAMSFAGETYPAVDPLAVQWGTKGSYVWTLTADSKVHQDPVEIIQRNSDGVLVKGDLKPGDQVVTQGVLSLAEGSAVRRIDADTAEAAPTPAAATPATPPARARAGARAGAAG